MDTCANTSRISGIRGELQLNSTEQKIEKEIILRLLRGLRGVKAGSFSHPLTAAPGHAHVWTQVKALSVELVDVQGQLDMQAKGRSLLEAKLATQTCIWQPG
eukprot:363324-Chlamydomonas_euryale.AAC.7